jgi:SPP1 gp7 family putative phage head morphogenesis protein
VTWKVGADPDRPEEAISFFQSKLQLTDYEFNQLDERSKHFAFSAAGASRLDLVSDLFNSLNAALANGTTLEQFKEEIGAKMTEAWGHPDGARIENIFRTNLLSAYSAGRWVEMTDPAVLASRPYGRFSAIMESRTCAICGRLNGTVLPLSDSWWQFNSPLIHYQCRCEIENLTEAEAKGTVADRGPDVKVSPGFGRPPMMLPWAPELDTKPPDVAAIYLARQRREKPPELPPPPPPAVRLPEVNRLPPKPLELPPPPVKDYRAEVLRDVEKEIVDRKTERAVVVGPEGGVRIDKVGTKNSVTFTEAEVEKMWDAILTHNHPSASSLSPDDIKLAITGNLKAVQAIGRWKDGDGSATRYEMRRGEHWPSWAIVRRAMEEVEPDVKRHWDAEIAALTDRLGSQWASDKGDALKPEFEQLYSKANHDHYHMVWTRVVEKLREHNWDVTYERTDHAF